MSTPFGSNASWKDCCYQYLLPPLHHAVWCAGTTACVAKQRTSLANPPRLNITFSFARLLITQLSPLIHCSTQLHRQQHQHKGRAGAEPKRGCAEDCLKASSTRERHTCRHRSSYSWGYSHKMQPRFFKNTSNTHFKVTIGPVDWDRAGSKTSPSVLLLLQS